MSEGAAKESTKMAAIAAAGAVVAGVVALFSGLACEGRVMGKKDPVTKQSQTSPGATTPGWDPVDEAGWESFPASDPPAVDSAFESDGALREPDMSLDDAERQALHDALDDEYRAWATYDQVIRDFGAERPFINIREAEARHIEALCTLFRRYRLEIPENTWPERVPRFASLREACEAGVEGEIANVALYERIMESTNRQDILAVFDNLQRASQERHLPAFRRCAGRLSR